MRGRLTTGPSFILGPVRNAIGPILVIVVAGLLLWGCSAAFTDHEKSNGGSGDNCPYIGPGGC